MLPSVYHRSVSARRRMKKTKCHGRHSLICRTYGGGEHYLRRADTFRAAADLRRSNTMVLRPQAHGNRSLAAADRKYTHENARLLALVLAIAFFQFFVAPFAVPLTVPSGVALIVLCMITTPLQWG